MAPRVPLNSSSGISSITLATQNISSLPSCFSSSGVHSLSRDRMEITPSVNTSRGELASQIKTPGIKMLDEYRKKTKDNTGNSKDSHAQYYFCILLVVQ